jgi:hypothetical protein
MTRFKFGDIIENGWAGEGNPRKRGIYLRSFHRSGRMNPGHHVELQHEDGKRSEFLIADDDKLVKVGTIFDHLIDLLECLKDARRLLTDQDAIDLEYVDSVIAKASTCRNNSQSLTGRE